MKGEYISFPRPKEVITNPMANPLLFVSLNQDIIIFIGQIYDNPIPIPPKTPNPMSNIQMLLIHNAIPESINPNPNNPAAERPVALEFLSTNGPNVAADSPKKNIAKENAQLLYGLLKIMDIYFSRRDQQYITPALQ